MQGAVSSIADRRRAQRLGLATLLPTQSYLAGWLAVAEEVAGCAVVQEGARGSAASSLSLAAGVPAWSSGLSRAGASWPLPPTSSLPDDPVSLPFHLGRLRASLGHHTSIRRMGAFGWIPQRALADVWGVEWTPEEMNL
jgi:hypothetical protein